MSTLAVEDLPIDHTWTIVDVVTSQFIMQYYSSEWCKLCNDYFVEQGAISAHMNAVIDRWAATLRQVPPVLITTPLVVPIYSEQPPLQIGDEVVETCWYKSLQYQNLDINPPPKCYFLLTYEEPMPLLIESVTMGILLPRGLYRCTASEQRETIPLYHLGWIGEATELAVNRQVDAKFSYTIERARQLNNVGVPIYWVGLACVPINNHPNLLEGLLGYVTYNSKRDIFALYVSFLRGYVTKLQTIVGDLNSLFGLISFTVNGQLTWLISGNEYVRIIADEKIFILISYEPLIYEAETGEQIVVTPGVGIVGPGINIAVEDPLSLTRLISDVNLYVEDETNKITALAQQLPEIRDDIQPDTIAPWEKSVHYKDDYNQIINQLSSSDFTLYYSDLREAGYEYDPVLHYFTEYIDLTIVHDILNKLGALVT